MLKVLGRNRRKRGQRLSLYEHGLVVVAARGRTAAYRWDAVTVSRKTVRRGFEKSAEWGPAIAEAVARAGRPQSC
ncbi:hypothetical protein [Mangrovactinospora gilvigrisea]|uniref:hypothetical protein n=1 Tax=Mangrovactinospora gilvigrisea TaxID=1428644 RepID=UPI0011148165|nr:hypothetical protein [Mangrovactinospora gilvigrisea]